VFVGTMFTPQRAEEAQFQGVRFPIQAVLDVLLLLLAKCDLFEVFRGYRQGVPSVSGALCVSCNGVSNTGVILVTQY